MMNKLPTKQIYLLLIIVLGIISLSVYSTYSIFTFDSQTSDIVSINTPNSLVLLTSTNEYKQINVKNNSYVTTDIDIYNNFEYNLCYSIWYKVNSNKEDIISKIKIYENTVDTKTTSGIIEKYTSRRVNLIVVNDSDNDVSIKIGLSYNKEEETCSLNLSSDKSLITSTLNNPKDLSTTLINTTEVTNSNADYLTYKNIEKSISLSNYKELFIAKKFTYNNELFKLEEPISIKAEEVTKYISNPDDNYYICLDNQECKIIYRIIDITEDNGNYYINKYDKMIGYLSGPSGLRKINNDYLYYGDNPNNFIYYNCTNIRDTNTCELWRIVGFIYDEKTNKYLTKIIRNESIGLYDYSNFNQSWYESNIYKYLNEKYKLLNPEYLKEITYKQSYMNNIDMNLIDIKKFDNDIKSKVNILSLEDYLYSSTCEYQKVSDYTEECLNNNWLNNYDIDSSWTITAKYEEPYTDEETNELVTPNNNEMYTINNEITNNLVTDKLNVRPVVYLNSRLFMIDGNGSLNNPYVIR